MMTVLYVNVSSTALRTDKNFNKEFSNMSRLDSDRRLGVGPSPLSPPAGNAERDDRILLHSLRHKW